MLSLLKELHKRCSLSSFGLLSSAAACSQLIIVQGTRDYSIGEGADVSVQAAAQTMGLDIRQDFKAQQVDFEKDIVKFDVVFVMDKYTAADILREVRFRPISRKQTLAKGVFATCGSSHK